MRRTTEPIGLVLAGGLGRRIGGSKAVVRLSGQPLISYPLAAMISALRDVAIVVKPDTELPSLPGVTVWIEPSEPRHPLVGIVHGLALAGGRPVLACASDLPFVTAELIRRIAAHDPGGAPAVVAACGGRMQPLLGRYQPGAIEALRAAAAEELPVLDAIAALGLQTVEVDDEDELFNINSPDDLLQAAAMLDHRLTF
jgi:molybdopterin-guanine dinucleotide biosynthesis protein A